MDGVTRIEWGDKGYPPNIMRYLGRGAPAAISLCGDAAILIRPMLALFCSARCPGDLIVAAYDLARGLRDAGMTVAGGFHAPMERECFDLLLRGAAPVVYCPARGLAGMRLAPDWRTAVAEGRLLLISPFDDGRRRASAEMACARNRFLAALAGAALVVHAAPGGKIAALAVEVAAWGLPLYAPASPHNAALMELGAQQVAMSGIADWARDRFPLLPIDHA